MNTVVFPDGLIVCSMYRCVPVLSVLLCLCEDYELFGIVVLPMWRSALPSSQSPPRRQFSNREPVWHGATLLKLRMTRASQPFVTSDAEAFAPDPNTLKIAKRLHAELQSHYTVAEFLSDMPHGTARHNSREHGRQCSQAQKIAARSLLCDRAAVSRARQQPHGYLTSY